MTKMIGMDAVDMLQIEKSAELKERFPITRFSSKEVSGDGQWIVFSSSLTSTQFEELDFKLGEYTPILDVWKVGSYDVALMPGRLTSKHQTILNSMNIDYAEVADIPDLSKPGLIVFDMDSTVIQIECIDEIAKLAGVGELVSEVTERAMQGELDFEQSLRQRVAALKGADEAILQQVRLTLPLMPDLKLLIASLKHYGWKTAIASGGFTYFSDYLKETLELDYAQSNVLDIADGRLTGNVVGEVVSANSKAEILETLAKEYAIDMSNTVAVGDGANDLIMMGVAGLGVAYHAKPKVEQQAPVAVRYAGLGGVLCALSVSIMK